MLLTKTLFETIFDNLPIPCIVVCPDPPHFTVMVCNRHYNPLNPELKQLQDVDVLKDIMEKREAVRLPAIHIRGDNGFLSAGYWQPEYLPLIADNHLSYILCLWHPVERTEKSEPDKAVGYIGIVSHELKTPLTALGANIQILRTKLQFNHDRAITDILENTEKQVKKLNLLINSFLDNSKPATGELYLKKQVFCINELLQEILTETKVIMSSHEVSLFISGEPNIYADREKIGSVITNLLSNAAKYSPNKKPIVITCKQTRGHIRVSVQDQGIGIRTEDVGKLFDRFYRVSSTDTKHIPGLGLGLYLSAEIMKEHKGQLWAESEYGIGSTFHFTLPLGNHRE